MSQKAQTESFSSDPQLDRLCQQLSQEADSPESERLWPSRSLELCAQNGVFAWFIGKPYDGKGWSSRQITEGYLAPVSYTHLTLPTTPYV